jgi:cathepsin L
MKGWQIALLVTLALTSLSFINGESEEGKEFEQWKADFGMVFSAEEEPYRQIVFLQNLKEINSHNADSTQKYQKGVNHFSHLTKSEFHHMFLSSIYSGHQSSSQPTTSSLEFSEPLTEIDWQALGRVSPVKDQGVCDAGYAFCSTALIESFYLFSGRNVFLSEQQIIDCSADYTTFGCQGGSRIGTINYIREKGLTSTDQYPYRGSKNNCQKPTGGDNKPSYTHVEFNGCDALQSGLYSTPMTVAVNAKDWQSYKSGIYDGCTSTEVNHDTYLIGMSSGYWRIKNSWSIRWG